MTIHHENWPVLFHKLNVILYSLDVGRLGKYIQPFQVYGNYKSFVLIRTHPEMVSTQFRSRYYALLCIDGQKKSIQIFAADKNSLTKIKNSLKKTHDEYKITTRIKMKQNIEPACVMAATIVKIHKEKKSPITAFNQVLALEPRGIYDYLDDNLTDFWGIYEGNT